MAFDQPNQSPHRPPPQVQQQQQQPPPPPPQTSEEWEYNRYNPGPYPPSSYPPPSRENYTYPSSSTSWEQVINITKKNFFISIFLFFLFFFF